MSQRRLDVSRQAAPTVSVIHEDAQQLARTKIITFPILPCCPSQEDHFLLLILQKGKWGTHPVVNAIAFSANWHRRSKYESVTDRSHPSRRRTVAHRRMQGWGGQQRNIRKRIPLSRQRRIHHQKCGELWEVPRGEQTTEVRNVAPKRDRYCMEFSLDGAQRQKLE